MRDIWLVSISFEMLKELKERSKNLSVLDSNNEKILSLLIKKSGIFVGRTAEELEKEGILEQIEITADSEIAKKVINDGYVEISDIEEISKITELVKSGICKLILVPRTFEFSPLISKKHYCNGISNYEKVESSIRKIEELLKSIKTESIKRELEGKLKEIKEKFELG